ncbi:MAG: TPM domain-containing protein [Bacteroidetes bacterium]|nr:MAG: TPM domain-containing protein [Bacteroidota bacterium]
MKHAYIILVLAILALAVSCQPEKVKVEEVTENTATSLENSNTLRVIDTGKVSELVPTGWVNDYDKIFTADEAKKLHKLIDDFEKETTVEIAVVTLDTSMVGAEMTDLYAATFALANKWGVGKKGKNNGILIGIAKGWEQMYIQNAEGIEMVLSDEQTQQIVDTVFLPNYAQGDFYKGTNDGLLTIMKHLKKSNVK